VKGFELTLLALHSSLVDAKWLITTVDLRSRPYELLSCIGQSRKSNLLCPQRLHRIKLRCLPRWDQARNHCNREQKHRGPHKHSGIKDVVPYNIERISRVVGALVINPRTNPASAGRNRSTNGHPVAGKSIRRAGWMFRTRDSSGGTT
jgi:hypothetical protein